LFHSSLYFFFLHIDIWSWISILFYCSTCLFKVSIILVWLLYLYNILWNLANMLPPVLFFLVKNSLAIQDLLWFCTYFRFFFLFLWRMMLVFSYKFMKTN
jgi:hypothetical protein